MLVEAAAALPAYSSEHANASNKGHWNTTNSTRDGMEINNTMPGGKVGLANDLF